MHEARAALPDAHSINDVVKNGAEIFAAVTSEGVGISPTINLCSG